MEGFLVTALVLLEQRHVPFPRTEHDSDARRLADLCGSHVQVMPR